MDIILIRVEYPFSGVKFHQNCPCGRDCAMRKYLRQVMTATNERTGR